MSNRAAIYPSNYLNPLPKSGPKSGSLAAWTMGYRRAMAATVEAERLANSVKRAELLKSAYR